MVHDVFIGHAHKDKSVADAICERLESAGVRCWIAGRDISAGEDWTEATRNAIGSSRVMVLLLSENANSTPHIQREIAHAFYTKRIIISLRLTNTLPSRDFLFYLGNVRWFDAFSTPAEEHLEALTANIKELVPGRTVPPNPMSPPSGIKNSGKDALQTSDGRTLGILKNVVIVTGLFAVASLTAFWPWQTDQEESLRKGNLQPMRHGPSASLDSLPQAPGDASEGKSTYTYTRFGLWSASKTGPTPSVQQGRHAKSRSKSHNGRDSKSRGLRFADIKSRLRRLWHQIVASSK